jgi:hypothetical protein
MCISAMTWFICAYVLSTTSDLFTSALTMPSEWTNIKSGIESSSGFVFLISVAGTALWALLSSFRKTQQAGPV